MTRLERLRDQQAREKARKAAAQLREAQVTAQLRAEERKDRHKLHMRWGKILDALGLLDVEEDILMDALKVLAMDLVKEGCETSDNIPEVFSPDTDSSRLPNANPSRNFIVQ